MEQSPPPQPAYSKAYLGWALALLTLAYTSSFMDRTILSIVQEQIKQELALTDTQLGLLGGFAFALFYSVLGVPVARLAERYDRRWIIAAALLIWSVTTALCATARSFGSLFLFRMGVSVGEAGASPPAHSLITDYFPARKRALAISIYSCGLAAGVLFGATLGGYIAQHFGWRTGFVVFGLPGAVLAALMVATLREPTRGASEALQDQANAVDIPSLGQVVRHIARDPAMRHLAAGSSIAAFAGYAVNTFSAIFFLRNFDLSLTTTGLYLGLTAGLGVGIGMLAGGFLTQRLVRRDVRWYMWLPAISLLVAAPIYASGFSAASSTVAIALLFVAPVIHYLYFGSTFAAMHNMVYPRMRATTTALFYLLITLVGLGLGPTLIGAMSDRFAARAFGAVGEFSSACPGGSAPAGSVDALKAACHHASATGVRYALILCCLAFLWAAAHYALGARTLRRSLVSN